MIRVFPRRTKWTPTDALAFVGDPPLDFLLPPEQPVRVSVTFTWDRSEGERLAKAWSLFYRDVQVGGPAYGDPGGEFIPGRFLKEGVVITSRGCWKPYGRCPWCVVPSREGRIRQLRIQPGYIVQDNNVLACGREHLVELFGMLRKQPRGAIFAGGFDAILFQRWHRDLVDSISVRELFFACDSPAALAHLERIAPLLDGISRKKLRCYVMIGFNGETVKEAEARLKRVWELGFLPFSQLYQGDVQRLYSKDWQALNKTFSRPAATVSTMQSEPEDLPLLDMMVQSS